MNSKHIWVHAMCGSCSYFLFTTRKRHTQTCHHIPSCYHCNHIHFNCDIFLFHHCSHYYVQKSEQCQAIHHCDWWNHLLLLFTAVHFIHHCVVSGLCIRHLYVHCTLFDRSVDVICSCFSIEFATFPSFQRFHVKGFLFCKWFRLHVTKKWWVSVSRAEKWHWVINVWVGLII